MSYIYIVTQFISMYVWGYMYVCICNIWLWQITNSPFQPFRKVGFQAVWRLEGFLCLPCFSSGRIQLGDGLGHGPESPTGRQLRGRGHRQRMAKGRRGLSSWWPLHPGLFFFNHPGGTQSGLWVISKFNETPSVTSASHSISLGQQGCPYLAKLISSF